MRLGRVLALMLALSGPVPAFAQPEQVKFAGIGEFGGTPVTLNAWLYRPTGAGPFPAVVMMHGCSGMHDREGNLTRGYRYRAELLREQGYLVLLPDSFGPRGYRSICSLRPRPVLPGRDRSRDAYAAARWLTQQPEVDPASIALAGWSNGGATVLAAMQRAPADLPRFRAAIAFYPSCSAAARRDPPYAPYAPLLILIGEADDWTPAAPCVDLAKRADTSTAELTVVTFPEAHHAFDSVGAPLRRREDVGNSNSPSGRGATVGEHPASREQAHARMREFLTQHLARQP